MKTNTTDTRRPHTVVAGALTCLALLALPTPSFATDVTPGCGGLYQTKCEFKRATSHGKAQNVGCPQGSFFDPRKGGECWSCPAGFGRTLAPVTAGNACSQGLFGKTIAATFVRTVWGCGGGQFFDPTDGGSCWSCPQYHNRSIHSVKGDLACTVYAQYTCDEGNKLQGNICVYSREKEIETKARAELQKHANVILSAAHLAVDLGDNPSFGSAIKSNDPHVADRVGGEPSYGEATQQANGRFNTMSVGAVASSSAIFVGGSLETGVAIDFKGTRPVYWYVGASYKFGPALSLDGGLNLGFWLAENNHIWGDSEGFVFGLSDLLSAAKVLAGAGSASKAFDLKAGKSLAVGIWFDTKTGDFQGFTVSPTVSAGVDFGGYAKATTGQITE
ncbi:MAG: hypothetical protein KC933_15185 [Myxococcales bacterium]|nr:hypothetical protein [Myxococcales bacterium]MCB9652020.1 hypothetical protein [Deltaproteobacteria bacterium]